MKLFSLFLTVILFIAAASAIEYKEEHHGYQQHHGYEHHGGEQHHGYEHHEHHEEEHHAPAHYEFHYSVHDPHTGDIKSQKETRNDHKVEGVYELIDSDGHHRIVKYSSDKHKGFEAVVIREPTDIKIPIPEHHEQHHSYEHHNSHDQHKNYEHKSYEQHKTISHSAPIVHYGHKAETHHSYY